MNAGPQFGFGYRHESRYYYDNQDPIWGPTNNVNNNLVTEISGVVGVGVKANLYEHFSVGLEYRQQFWLLSDNGQSTASIGDNYAPSYSTSNFLISAAYRFGKN
ncbi:MAG: outer membrane beta-barrel protein [Sphingobacteriales bacterium JAD_PAG50586_3]|nr:MAG: outer membrane beta-barrel protein [Sphingobacteriales bacterium JAD_PAG50586_3]